MHANGLYLVQVLVLQLLGAIGVLDALGHQNITLTGYMAFALLSRILLPFGSASSTASVGGGASEELDRMCCARASTSHRLYLTTALLPPYGFRPFDTGRRVSRSAVESFNGVRYSARIAQKRSER